jgi:glycosyltransferase involved in cell wall biosynthesis
MVAAQAALVPVRVYQMRGLLTATAHGVRKALFTAAERTSCSLAHHVVCQSPSLREYAIDHHLVSPQKSSVLANGSNGVDAEGRFNPENVTGLDVRRQLRVEPDARVIGFVGRIVGDKGIEELVDAWHAVKVYAPDAHLLMVGPFETRDSVPARVERTLRDDPRVHLVGFVRDTPRYYEAMDMLVLPSHREGFPNVPLEAAAMEVPTVTTNAIGCVDAVEHGVTGLRVDVGDSVALSRAILTYLEEPALRAEHGAAARARVLRDFRPEDIHHASLVLYQRLLGQSGSR